MKTPLLNGAAPGLNYTGNAYGIGLMSRADALLKKRHNNDAKLSLNHEARGSLKIISPMPRWFRPKLSDVEHYRPLRELR